MDVELFAFFVFFPCLENIFGIQIFFFLVWYYENYKLTILCVWSYLFFSFLFWF